MKFFYLNIKVGDHQPPLTGRTGSKVDGGPLKKEVTGGPVLEEPGGTGPYQGRNDLYTGGRTPGDTETLPDGKTSKLETFHVSISDEKNGGLFRKREGQFRQEFKQRFMATYGKNAWDSAVSKVRDRFGLGSNNEAEEKLWNLIYGFSSNVQGGSKYSAKHYSSDPSQIKGNEDITKDSKFSVEDREWHVGSQLCIPMRDGQIDFDETKTPDKKYVPAHKQKEWPDRQETVYPSNNKNAISGQGTNSDLVDPLTVLGEEFPYGETFGQGGKMDKWLKAHPEAVVHSVTYNFSADGGGMVITLKPHPNAKKGEMVQFRLTPETAGRFMYANRPTKPEMNGRSVDVAFVRPNGQMPDYEKRYQMRLADYQNPANTSQQRETKASRLLQTLTDCATYDSASFAKLEKKCNEDIANAMQKASVIADRDSARTVEQLKELSTMIAKAKAAAI